jgi:hypothetical protein
MLMVLAGNPFLAVFRAGLKGSDRINRIYRIYIYISTLRSISGLVSRLDTGNS